MKARLIIEGASLGPAELNIAFDTFDRARAAVAARFTDPDQIERARTRLALLVLSLMEDTKDVAELEAIVTQELLKGS